MLREPGVPPSTSASAAAVPPDSAEDPLILAVDLGTSSARTLVYDRHAQPVIGWEVHQPYKLNTTSDGGVTADAGSLVTLVSGCIDQLVRLVGKRQIAAVSADTFWHSLLGIDSAGVPLTPVYTWADTRSSEAAKELSHSLDVSAIHRRTGATIHSSYWPAKLLWLAKSQPDLFARVDKWISFADLLYLRLFGKLVSSTSMASGTGLFDIRRCAWDDELLSTVRVSRDQLSPVANFSETAQGLVREYAGRWPTLDGIPWYLPLGDGACNNIGSGGLDESRPVVMVGTSGAVRVAREVDDFNTPEGLWTYRIDRRRILQGGALSAGGNVFAWLAETLHIPDLTVAEREVAAMAPDRHGLTVLPFLAGERSPDWNPNAESAILGATLHTGSHEILRAFLEGVTYRFALVYNLLRRHLPEPEAIIGSGAGLVRSPAWMQIMADVLGQKLRMSAVAEASTRGSASLALEAMGAVADLSSIPAPLGAEFSANAENHSVYAKAIRRQEKLYHRILS